MKNDHLNFGRAAILGATVFLVMATKSPAVEPLPLEEWTVKAGSSQKTLNAAFLGFYNEKVYLWNGSSNRTFALTDFEGEVLARLQAHYQGPQRPYTLNDHAYIGNWELSPDVEFKHRGGEFHKIVPGSFEIAGLLTGLTDAQIVKKLTEAGYHLGPFEVYESQETKWDGHKADVPRAKRRYVTWKLYAELHRDSNGKPVSDLIRIRDGEYEDVRTVQVQFGENLGAEPFHVVAHKITSVLTSYVVGSKDIETGFLESARAKYGKPKQPGYWIRQYAGMELSGSPEILSVSSSAVSVDNTGLEVRLSQNLSLADDFKSKSTGAAKKLDF
jgi:hypothetical protein